MTTIESFQKVMEENFSLHDLGKAQHLYPQRIHHMLMFYSGFFFGGNVDTRTNPYGDYGIKVDVFSGEQNTPNEWSTECLNVFKKYQGKSKGQLLQEGYLHNYLNDALFLGNKNLKFGYSYDGIDLHKQSFYVDGFIEENVLNPECIFDKKVFDPIGFIIGNKPLWYIGCSVDENLLEKAIVYRKNPLYFLGGEIQERHNDRTVILDY